MNRRCRHRYQDQEISDRYRNSLKKMRPVWQAVALLHPLGSCFE
jgi:hypothetical protein